MTFPCILYESNDELDFQHEAFYRERWAINYAMENGSNRADIIEAVEDGWRCARGLEGFSYALPVDRELADAYMFGYRVGAHWVSFSSWIKLSSDERHAAAVRLRAAAAGVPSPRSGVLKRRRPSVPA